ncbi:MAG: hypothetical protein IJ360_05155 [Clostridia bacterium]|nr:hypothetical protein [Clostridia bacterium]
MKNRIILVVIFAVILATAIIIVALTSLFSDDAEGTVIGEVVMLYKEHVYIKPVGDEGTKQLLEFHIFEDTDFASGHSYKDFENAPELLVGTVVEIEYKYDSDTAKTTANGIKAVDPNDASSKWSELEFLEEVNGYNSKFEGYGLGTVQYIVRVDYPQKGYIVYLDESLMSLEKYWIAEDSIVADDKVIELLEEGEVGFKVKMSKYDNTELKGMWTAFALEYIEE